MDFGEKETFRGLNRATQSQRQTGSAIKPPAVLVPGINEKIFTGATIYNDEKTTFEKDYEPKNSDGGYLGEITVRRALESSQNIPFVEMMEQITPKKAISYLEKMGITSLTDEDESLALALGGLQNGVTPLEMASAYATIANDGIYIEPTFYSSIVDSRGRTVMNSEQERRTVFSEQVAYVLKKLLQQPVDGTYGTATYCAIPGIDVAAKTGTTDENYDKWLCGFTPYYTAVAWFGFDQNETIKYNNQNPAGIMWANVMRSIHDGFSGARFYQPSRIVTAEICADTGEIARTGCTNTYTEYFLSGTEPDECTKHTGSKVNTNIREDDTEENIIYTDDNNDLELNPDDEEVTNTEVQNDNNVTNENIQNENTQSEDIQNEVNAPPAQNNTVANDTLPENDVVDENEIIDSPVSDGNEEINNTPTGDGQTEETDEEANNTETLESEEQDV